MKPTTLARDFSAALSFLTRLPVPASGAADWGGAIVMYPVVGCLLGALLVLADHLLAWRGLPIETRSIVAVVVLIVITGGLHLDGLMDTCDGVLGGGTIARRLEIMRDSRQGSFGVLGCVCVVLLKVAGLMALAGTGRTTALFLAPVIGRWVVVGIAARFPSARPNGFGASFRAQVTAVRGGMATVITTLLCVWIGGGGGLLVLILAALGAVGMSVLWRRALGGLTGDTYGALIELTEVLVIWGCVIVL